MNKRRRRIGKFHRLAARRIREGKWLEPQRITNLFIERLVPVTVIGRFP